MAKKEAKKKKVPVRHEVIVRVAPQVAIPTSTELAEPIRDGKSLTIPKTWLSEKQITRMVEKTPPQFIYKRPGKGGDTWDYVTVGYVQRVLDYCFGFNWDFEIKEHGKEADHVWVMGKLTVKSPDGLRTITKTQFGRSEVKHKREGGLLDYGNDLKSAASDALKKCASMLGIARDIYSKADYRQESGKAPREEVKELPLAKDAPKADGPVFYCYGKKGGGCPYGNENIDEATYNYSMKRFKKALCRSCQKDVE